ncbi:MAG: right-handed parallel beta-helix repeat-containing protein, partial [Elusimicrobiota bacterium]|nr:right-handed parallel beta-helix repeat-containing protein [Elusimicrobiota bacterium]
MKRRERIFGIPANTLRVFAVFCYLLPAGAVAADLFPGYGAAVSASSGGLSFYTAYPAPAGCDAAATVNVAQSGAPYYSTIQAAVNALNQNLTADTCVVIRDTQTYSEQVTVQRINTGGYRLLIMADPTFVSSRPAVNPPTGSYAAFKILNTSVNVQGINIISTNTVTYGIYASSDSLNISSVNVISGGKIATAGILISSYSAVSYSSITVQNAHGLQVEGSSSTVSFSTMTSNFSGKYALYLLGATSNTITNSYISSLSGDGAYLKSGANYNAISYSTLISSSSIKSALYIYNSDYNTVTGSYIYNPKGYAARLSVSSSYNNILYSTMTSEDAGNAGLYISNSSGFNTITGSYIRSTLGRGAFLDLNANNNTIADSTITCNNATYSALFLTENSSTNTVTGSYISNTLGRSAYFVTGAYNTISYSTVTGGGSYEALSIITSSANIVSGSYVQGSTAAYISGSTATIFNSTVLVATNTAGYALRLAGGSVNLRLSSSTLSGGTYGAAIYLDAYNSGKLELSSNTVAGGGYGLNIATQSVGATLSISSLTFNSLTAGATAINFLGGTFVSTFTGMGFNTGDININGLSLSADSRITVRNSSGIKDGLAFENDPNGYVDWDDFVPPTVGITLPANDSFRNSLPQVAGTAADNAAVAAVEVAIKNNFNDMYWNGINLFNQSNPIWLSADVHPSSWTYDSSAVGIVNGSSYTVVAKARDTAGNWSVVYATSTFAADTVSPLVSVSNPVNERSYGGNSSEGAYYLSVMNGASADAIGIDKVEVQIYDVLSSSYWHTTGWTVNVSSWQGAGGTSWSYTPPPLKDGYRYRLEARAFDIAGNMSAYTTSYFYYDSAKPVPVLTAPGAIGFYNTLPQLAGTADASAAGGVYKSDMLKVEIGIQKDPPVGLWWTGAGFVSPDRVWLPDTSHTWPDWALSGASTPTWVTNTKYRVEARAMDVARNTSTIVTQEFVYDIQVPTVAITSPTGVEAYLGALPYISGTSADINSLGEIAQTSLRVKSLGNSQYWNWGTNNYTESSPDAAWFVVSTTETVPYSKWFSTGTPPGGPAGVNLVSGNSYEMNARAQDKAGNYSLVYSTRSITYDITKPTGAVTGLGGVPPAAYHRQIDPVNGSAFDGPSGSAAGLALINDGGSQARIREVDTEKWWDDIGGSFNIADGNTAWFSVNGGTSEVWSYTHAVLNAEMVNGYEYRVQYRGKDKSAPPNLGPSSNGNDSLFTLGKDSVTFIADKLAPVSRVTFPRDNARLKALATITGTAEDSLSGIAAMGQIAVSVQEVSPGAGWWDGVVPGTFTGTSETFYPLSGATLNGTYAAGVWSFSSPPLQDGYAYRVRVRAIDDAMPGGNVETAISSITFVYDITPPAAAIIYPVSLPGLGGNIKALASVSGTAFDSFGIKSASVSVREADSGLYYDTQSSTFNSPTQKWITASVSGSTPNYTWSAAAPPLTDSRNYELQVIADDLALNVMTPPAATAIRYDVTPPDSQITSPPADDSFQLMVSSIVGTATDFTSGISTVQIRIQQDTSQLPENDCSNAALNGYSWDGSGWQETER